MTYAELELIKPHRAAKGIPTSTVYAQILFEGIKAPIKSPFTDAEIEARSD